MTREVYVNTWILVTPDSLVLVKELMGEDRVKKWLFLSDQVCLTSNCTQENSRLELMIFISGAGLLNC